MVVSNEEYILTSTVTSEHEAHDFGKQCLLAGQYRVNLEIQFGSAQVAVNVYRRRRRAIPDAEIVVDSVSCKFNLPRDVHVATKNLSRIIAKVNPSSSVGLCILI